MQLITIQKKIYEIREQKVMLDFDLAQLYDVETKALNQAVKRNIKRFPEDFMFRLTPKEVEIMRSQIVTASQKKRNATITPYAFTEQGVAMLSGILNSDKAINVNISIMRAFVMVKQYALTYNALAEKIAKLEKKNIKQFRDIYDALNLLLSENQHQENWNERKRIGYRNEL
jgi:hypothetical protein